MGAGVPAADLREAVLQVFLFAGFPRAILAFERLELADGGAAVKTERDVPDPEKRGREIFGKIYGEHAERVVSKLERLHPDFARFVLRDAYGKVMGRPFLPLVERELMAVAMLAALELPKPLHAHVRGALEVGAEKDHVRNAIAAAQPVCSPDGYARAVAVAEELL